MRLQCAGVGAMGVIFSLLLPSLVAAQRLIPQWPPLGATEVRVGDSGWRVLETGWNELRLVNPEGLAVNAISVPGISYNVVAVARTSPTSVLVIVQDSDHDYALWVWHTDTHELRRITPYSRTYPKVSASPSFDVVVVRTQGFLAAYNVAAGGIYCWTQLPYQLHEADMWISGETVLLDSGEVSLRSLGLSDCSLTPYHGDAPNGGSRRTQTGLVTGTRTSMAAPSPRGGFSPVRPALLHVTSSALYASGREAAFELRATRMGVLDCPPPFRIATGTDGHTRGFAGTAICDFDTGTRRDIDVWAVSDDARHALVKEGRDFRMLEVESGQLSPRFEMSPELLPTDAVISSTGAHLLVAEPQTSQFLVLERATGGVVAHLPNERYEYEFGERCADPWALADGAFAFPMCNSERQGEFDDSGAAIPETYLRVHPSTPHAFRRVVIREPPVHNLYCHGRTLRLGGRRFPRAGDCGSGELAAALAGRRLTVGRRSFVSWTGESLLVVAFERAQVFEVVMLRFDGADIGYVRSGRRVSCLGDDCSMLRERTPAVGPLHSLTPVTSDPSVLAELLALLSQR
jgi:hypothetical protein